MSQHRINRSPDHGVRKGQSNSQIVVAATGRRGLKEEEDDPMPIWFTIPASALEFDKTDLDRHCVK